MDGFLKNMSQLTNFIFRVDSNDNLIAAVQPKVSFFQAHSNLSNFGQGGGDRLFEECGHNQTAHNDNGNAYKRRKYHGHKGLPVGLGNGDTSKNQAVNRSVGISGGDIRGQIFVA